MSRNVDAARRSSPVVPVRCLARMAWMSLLKKSRSLSGRGSKLEICTAAHAFLEAPLAKASFPSVSSKFQTFGKTKANREMQELFLPLQQVWWPVAAARAQHITGLLPGSPSCPILQVRRLSASTCPGKKTEKQSVLCRFAFLGRGKKQIC